MTAGTSATTVLVTGADAGYFPLLRDALDSVRRFPQAARLDVGVLDFGFDDQQRDWLDSLGVRVVVPEVRLDVPKELHRQRDLGYLTRPYLDHYFPGYDRYLWLDADTWVQTWEAIEQLVAGADSAGLAIAHETERSYRFQAWLSAWTAKHYLLGYGPVAGTRLILRRDRVNNGVFCLRRDAPHWAPWRTAMQAAVERSGNVLPHDQFALNQVLLLGRLPAVVLPPTVNWICDRGVPMWDATRSLFCVPRPPYDPISVMHLAGARPKQERYRLGTTDGGSLITGLRFGDRPPDEEPV